MSCACLLFFKPLKLQALVEEAQVAHLLAPLHEVIVHVRVRGVQAIHEVLPHRGVKEHRLLAHEADLLAPPADIPQENALLREKRGRGQAFPFSNLPVPTSKP